MIFPLRIDDTSNKIGIGEPTRMHLEFDDLHDGGLVGCYPPDAQRPICLRSQALKFKSQLNPIYKIIRTNVESKLR